MAWVFIFFALRILRWRCERGSCGFESEAGVMGVISGLSRVGSGLGAKSGRFVVDGRRGGKGTHTLL
jgi:hypothetical protein